MRVFIDTNVLLSASLFPSDGASRTYNVAVSAPQQRYCEQLRCG